LEKYVLDISYNKIINNKEENVNEKIIFFGIKENIVLMKKKIIKEYFLDITFKIIPKKFRPYKLMVIAGKENNAFNCKIILFILLKYLDKITYLRIFNYLIENMSFTPNIIHSDFEKAIHAAIKENNQFSKDIIHSRCFFHFSQMIRGKLTKCGLCKKKMNKKAIEIIKNIELLCFIELKNIKKFETIILDKLKNEDKLNSFIKYLKNYLFKLDPKIYNYTEIINYFKNNSSNQYLKFLYTTNNICETINSKLNHYLPKQSTTNYNFVQSIIKVISNESFKKKKKTRNDYISRGLLKLIEKEEFNLNLRWITFSEIKKYQEMIIKDLNEEINENNINNIINFINDLEIADKEN